MDVSGFEQERNGRLMMWRLALISILLLISACASKYDAPADARISTGPDASGYIVLGLASESYRRDFGHSTLGVALSLARAGGAPIVASRNGCGSMQGFYGSKPCDLSKIAYAVLVAPPGEYRPDTVAEELNGWGTKKLLRDKLKAGRPVHVGPGEIVYLGDFTLASDYDAQEIRLADYKRNDAAASGALAAFPGLASAPVVYRDPTLQ